MLVRALDCDRNRFRQFFLFVLRGDVFIGDLLAGREGVPVELSLQADGCCQTGLANLDPFRLIFAALLAAGAGRQLICARGLRLALFAYFAVKLKSRCGQP
jgi:hypothetical protein